MCVCVCVCFERNILELYFGYWLYNFYHNLYIINFEMIIYWNAFPIDNYQMIFSRNKIQYITILVNNMIYIQVKITINTITINYYSSHKNFSLIFCSN